jgi:tRNA (guanine9-N1)-methyltransferase
VKFLDCGFVEAAEEAKKWMSDEKYGGKLAGAFSACVFPNHGSDEADAHAVAKLKEDAEVVYLTSESPNTLTVLKPYSTYIIGGLVDKNREKGICYKRAVEAGVKTAKLPIGEFMEMQSRKVLATNHVNEICVKWLECGDWGEAFLKVIPKRKGGKLKGDHGEQAVETEEDDDGEDADGVTNDVEEVEDAEIATDVA